MPDDERPMVSAPIPASDPSCPLCGRTWTYAGHLQRSPRGERCRIDGCKAQRFEACMVDGAVVGMCCLSGHRWAAPIDTK